MDHLYHNCYYQEPISSCRVQLMWLQLYMCVFLSIYFSIICIFIAETKVSSSVPIRFCEDEGFYVGGRPHVKYSSLSTMEGRFLLRPSQVHYYCLYVLFYVATNTVLLPMAWDLKIASFMKVVHN